MSDELTDEHSTNPAELSVRYHERYTQFLVFILSSLSVFVRAYFPLFLHFSGVRHGWRTGIL